ncbi:C-terminal binding protein [Tropicimonas sediminicola]|uniref:D-3-phosphoglycerate dehydrogenase n=1 Tax=Tropicimonas sediminicola TaxID=1031541 RepID=A0A239KVV1_9RHOB|nr:C-terminal binding protein [Tropicimonas sediminicola]SNT22351.1 D-3-phosphoglycerate dehydrogenase [Tropicimonas sediminicola]
MKIVVSDCDHESMSIEQKVLSDAGLGFEHYACRSEDDLIAQCEGANAILTQYGPFTDRVLAALRPSLGIIVRYGVGVDTVDLEAATRHGVQVCNVPDYGMYEVSDHALGLMLALVRKIPMISAAAHRGEWDYRLTIPVRRVKDMTVGVLGVGRIGRLFAEKASALGCRVVLCDPYKPGVCRQLPGTDEVDFDELLREADVISVHCPLSNETRGILDRGAIARMKPGAILINTARGGIIDEEALAEALASGKLSGAGIDVVESEPLAASSPLLRFDNCIVTPHMGWYSEESAQELKRKVAEEAVRFARGEAPRYPVNTPVAGERRTATSLAGGAES